MASRHSMTGMIVLTAVLLGTSCATAFLVPVPEQTIIRQASFCPATGPNTLGSRSATTATGLRSSRLPFTTQADGDGDGDDADYPASAGRGARAVGFVGCRRQTAAGPLKATAGAGAREEDGGGGRDLTATRRALLLAIWLSFVAYAFGPWSPGAVVDPKDLELVTHLYDTVVPQSEIFVSVFNSLGLILPPTMASLLVGGGAFAKGRQPVPPQPFVFGAFALGYMAAGPYLALRNYLPQPAADEGEEMSNLEKFLTSKILAVPLLALAAYLDFSIVAALSDPEAISGFSDLFWSSKLVHISTLDFCVLNVVIVDPIREDMRRRGVAPELAKVALFSVPLVGPALWMLVRPPVVVE